MHDYYRAPCLDQTTSTSKSRHRLLLCLCHIFTSQHITLPLTALPRGLTITTCAWMLVFYCIPCVIHVPVLEFDLHVIEYQLGSTLNLSVSCTWVWVGPDFVNLTNYAVASIGTSCFCCQWLTSTISPAAIAGLLSDGCLRSK